MPSAWCSTITTHSSPHVGLRAVFLNLLPSAHSCADTALCRFQLSSPSPGSPTGVGGRWWSAARLQSTHTQPLTHAQSATICSWHRIRKKGLRGNPKPRAGRGHLLLLGIRGTLRSLSSHQAKSCCKNTTTAMKLNIVSLSACSSLLFSFPPWLPSST